MDNELFSAADIVMESPRLRWIRKHAIRVSFWPNKPLAERYTAHSTNRPATCPPGMGPTAEEACQDFGVKNNIALWNEESP